MFVVVATRARDAQAHHRRADDVDLIIDDIHCKILIHGHCGFRADCQKPGRDELAIALFGGFGRQQVAGDLLGQEALVRDVVIEGLDDVVAVAPRVGKCRVAPEAIVAVRFPVARDVQPVAAPAFAELRGCEQAIDERFNCLASVARVLSGEGCHCLDLRRQAGEVVVEAADQFFWAGVLSWRL